MLAISAGEGVCAEKWRVQYFYDKNHSSLAINDLADIPGTHSAWAVGGYFTDTTANGWVPTGGVILRRGN